MNKTRSTTIHRRKNWKTGAFEWDMYIDGRWIGTTATKAQAEQSLARIVSRAHPLPMNGNDYHHFGEE